MATFKDHQAAMVELLAHGIAIPASATRLAHALHDVLAVLNDKPVATEAHTERRSEATTPGLNDAALAYDLAAVTPKQTYLESLLKQRDNTIRQLKARVADLVIERDEVRNDLKLSLAKIREASNPEQSGCRKPDVVGHAGCRKEDTQECPHPWTVDSTALGGTIVQELCGTCGEVIRERPASEGWIEAMTEQAGCRKEDTQVADGWIEWHGGECPVSPGNREVRYRMRNGSLATDLAINLWWDHRGGDADITDYRVLGEEE